MATAFRRTFIERTFPSCLDILYLTDVVGFLNAFILIPNSIYIFFTVKLLEMITFWTELFP